MCVNKPQGVLKVRNALQTSCYLLKTTPPFVYKARVCQFFLGDSADSCVLSFLSLSSCNRLLDILSAHHSVHLFIGYLFGSNNSNPIKSKFQQAGRSVFLIKSSVNVQNIQDTFYKKVNSGTSHYPSLISLIKSIPVTSRRHR